MCNAECISVREVKARKDHRCCACRDPIPSGFSYIKTFEKVEGEILGGKWHKECLEEFERLLALQGDDCAYAGDTWEDGWMPEEIQAKYKVTICKNTPQKPMKS